MSAWGRYPPVTPTRNQTFARLSRRHSEPLLSIRCIAPMLAKDSREILRELGDAEGKIAVMVVAGVLAV